MVILFKLAVLCGMLIAVLMGSEDRDKTLNVFMKEFSGLQFKIVPSSF